MKLPFLQETKWPTNKEPEERIANPSYDKQLQDHLMDELILALDRKDVNKFREAISALVHHIKSEEHEGV